MNKDLNHFVEPSEKVWRGPEDGLPPVGEMVEAWYDDGRECWKRAVVIGYHPESERTIAVNVHIEGHGWKLIWANNFSPLRSEEDKAVEEMTRISMDTPMINSLDHIEIAHRDACRALYRAGYRKQEAK